MYVPDLQADLLKTNPSTLLIASAKIIDCCRQQGCEARKFYSLGGATCKICQKRAEETTVVRWKI